MYLSLSIKELEKVYYLWILIKGFERQARGMSKSQYASYLARSVPNK